MADIVSVMRRADNLNTSPQFDSYSRVKIYLGDNVYVTAGDDTGRTLEIDNPFGTQQMATDILAKLQGYQYQPYTADGALLNPAAEIGDGVSVGGTYGGIYQRSTTFSRLMKADISAPEDKEINHEYKYESPTERRYSREIGEVRASLILQNSMIEAKVDSTSDNQSFGWQLLQDHWSVISSGREIFRVDENGGSFAGSVAASSGQIGGFTITASSIYNNISEFGGTQSSGVYIGTNGIQVGQGFKASSSGSVEATGIRLKGVISFLDSDGNVTGTMSAADLRTGAFNAYSWLTNGTAANWSLGYRYGSNYYSMSSGASYARYLQSEFGRFSKDVTIGTTLSVEGAVTLKNNYMYWGSQKKYCYMIPITINGTSYHVLGYNG